MRMSAFAITPCLVFMTKTGQPNGLSSIGSRRLAGLDPVVGLDRQGIDVVELAGDAPSTRVLGSGTGTKRISSR